MAVTRLVCVAVMVSVCAGHGHMSKPTIRRPRPGDGRADYTPLAFMRPDGFHPKPGKELGVPGEFFGWNEDDFACRGGVRGPVPTGNVLTAGKSYTFEVTLYAPHPGDVGIFVSYDTDEQTPKDADKDWYLIKKIAKPICCDCSHQQAGMGTNNCGGCDLGNSQGKNVCSYMPGPVDDLGCAKGCHQVRPLSVMIPDWLPAGKTVILRLEYYALHLRDNNPGHASGGNQIEFYANCADVEVVGSGNSVKVNELRGGVKIKRAQHLPQTNTGYPVQYNRMTKGYESGPMVYSAVATFDDGGSMPDMDVIDEPQNPPEGEGTSPPGGNSGPEENPDKSAPTAVQTAAPTIVGKVCKQNLLSTGCTIDGGNCDDYYFKVDFTKPPLSVCQCQPTLDDYPGVYCPTKSKSESGSSIDSSSATTLSSAAIVASHAALFLLTRFLR